MVHYEASELNIQYYSDENFTPSPQRISWEDVRRRYSLGFASETPDPVLSSDATAAAAYADLSEFVDAIESSGRERGWDECQDDMEFTTDEAVQSERARADAAIRRLKDHVGAPLDELEFFLNSMKKSDPPPVDDEEKWAHQDGFNEAIEKVVRRVSEIRNGLR